MTYDKLPHLKVGFFVLLVSVFASGCTVVSAVDAVASTAIGVTKVAVKGTTAVVGAVIPDGDDEKDKKEEN